jgi:hypothetical protein
MDVDDLAYPETLQYFAKYRPDLDPEEVLGFIEDFKGKSRDTESETEQEIWDVYCRLRRQFLEATKTEPLPPSLSSSVSPLPNQASGKPC